MPVGNSSSPSTFQATTPVVYLNRSNSPFQMVPCSPYIGKVTHGHQSPAPQVPNVRTMAMTPDIGHMVPRTPDINLNGISRHHWTKPSSNSSSISHGEQLVPQTPLSSSHPGCPTRKDNWRVDPNSTANTPGKETHRERRRLPDSPMTDVQQPNASTANLDLFRGDDIFG